MLWRARAEVVGCFASQVEESMEEQAALRVGELARRTGLTVRTLHHFDELGLLRPSTRTKSGHRLYGEADLRRLQQILSLRALGVPLDQIGSWLKRPDASLLGALEVHLAELDERLSAQRRLRDRLAATIGRLRANGGLSVNEILDTLEATTMFEKYYTTEQLEQLKQRRESIGEEQIRAVEKEWGEIFRTLAAAQAAGKDPGSPEMRKIGRRANELVEAFTGGDPGIRASLNEMYAEEGPAPAARHGMPADPALWKYLGEVMAAGKDGG
jgi:DNA-binding transcriptional MerR regulator